MNDEPKRTLNLSLPSGIHRRMLIIFVLLVVLPITPVIITSIVTGLNSGKELALGQLESVASLKHGEIKIWAEHLVDNLALCIAGASMKKDVELLLTEHGPCNLETQKCRDIYTRLKDDLAVSDDFEELFIVSQGGDIVLATSAEPTAFLKAMRRTSTPRSIRAGVHLQENLIIAARPIKNSDGDQIGHILGQVRPNRLFDIMLERSGLGDTGETYLVSPENTLLTPSRFEDYHPGETLVNTKGAKAALKHRTSAQGLYNDYRGVPIIGVYRWLPELEAALLAERDQAEVFAGTHQAMTLNLGVALSAILLAIVLAFIVARTITKPITALADAAARIAGGDLTATVQAAGQDEIGVLGASFNDMSKRLNILIKDLESRNTELERFTYTISHELKTPLITIGGFTGIIQKAIYVKNMKRIQFAMERIADATETMNQLLEDLLALSKTGAVAGQRQNISLNSIIDEALKLSTTLINDRGVNVIIEPGLPVVYADRLRLIEVLQNLIENAVTFMGNQPEPEIKIGERVHNVERVYYVTDNGIGIDAAYKDRIFGLFERLDEHSHGTGVGLAIAKRIVEIHGGRIWVESEGVGKGSTFCFTISDT